MQTLGENGGQHLFVMSLSCICVTTVVGSQSLSLKRELNLVSRSYPRADGELQTICNRHARRPVEDYYDRQHQVAEYLSFVR